MLEIGTSGLMSGEGKRADLVPRPSSTLHNFAARDFGQDSPSQCLSLRH